MTKTAETAPLAIGTRIVDADGFEGTISNVTHYEGRFWYDVRFPRGSAVRYPGEVTAR